MNAFWVIMGYMGLLMYFVMATAKWPWESWKASIKRNLKTDIKIYALSIFLQLTISVGWYQTGLDDLIAFFAPFVRSLPLVPDDFVYDGHFFPQGKLNMLLAVIGLLMHFLINFVWKRITKPHEEKK